MQVEMNKHIEKLLLAAAFCLLFISIGWLAPAMYASYAPDDHFIEVNTFEPNNATVDSDSHMVCWDREVHRESTGDVIMELYLLDENGNEQEIDTTSFKSYFDDSNVKSILIELPKEKLSSGKYEYHAVIKMNLANGRVERIFSYKSEPFYIKNDTTAVSPHSPVDC